VLPDGPVERGLVIGHGYAGREAPAVPPPGQFAVYNALHGPRDLVVLATGHVEDAESVVEQQTLLAAQRRFLTAHLRDG
jgi:cephalosporin-C deacetylase-like acetyl esterase